ncbi:MAG TPA: ABC transporter permease [Acidimicrobiia bacterium]|nr:ABC transporter permease [Acidimicrobiia bacterium]
MANVTAADLARIERELGLDRPVIIQYLDWVRRFVTGDWGISFVARRPVLDLVFERLPATLLLMGSGLVLSLVISVPLGVLAAMKRGRWLDSILTFGSFVGLSIPAFWLGLMLIVVFTVWLGWLPGVGIGPPGVEPDLATRLRYLILPTVTISFVSVGFFTRYLRSSMIEVLHRDHIRFARSRGLPRWRVYLRHAFRNAATPFVTVVAIHIPEYLIGALVVETIFSWPGTGRLFWESAVRFDYPVMMGILVLGALLVVISNLMADVAYATLDPRVRYD